jgi:WD40-like Beta Propeller Repeat
MYKLVSFLFLFHFLNGFAQTGSEIILFDLKIQKGKPVLENGVNITNHKGYDNQPFFHPKEPVIYYSSFNDSGRSDIKTFNYKTNVTYYFTTTNEREYSPTVTPDGKFISCIIQRDNGAQDLGQYPITSGKPQVLISNLVVGYHAWINKSELLLFVLGDSIKPNTLHLYNIATKKDTVLASNIGRSLHQIPGEAAMSFTEKISEKDYVIKKFNPATKEISVITDAVKGQDHLTWLQNGLIVMSDGSQLYFLNTKEGKGWEPITINSHGAILKGITRLATNQKNIKLAVVVSE